MCKKRFRLDIDRGFSKDFRLHKKAQITIFIILGILMLLTLIIVIGIKKEVITLKPEELLPTEKGKVENYLTTCIDKLGEEALYKIGLQAGYIEVPKTISSNNNLHLKLSPLAVVPYWAYGPNTNIPSLQEIKERIDFYIEENLRECLFGMKPFTESYDFTEKSQIQANTEIVESKVIFNVHWDIVIKDKAGEVVTEIIDHVTESPIKLKQVYDTAKRIIDREMVDMKLEDITQDLIALEHPDLPVSGYEISCTKKTWSVQTAKETLLSLLRVNLKQLKIKGTDFVEFPENLPYYQNHYVWDLGEEFVKPKVSVVFDFEESFPYTFAVTPISGGKMKSSQLGGGSMLSYVCIQNWKFTYDVVYPVLVRVKDETTGYIFNTAFTVHLIRNFPNRGKEVEAVPAYYINTITDEEACKNKNVPMTVKTYETVDNNQGVGYREDLGDVNISFICIKYLCEIGQTKYDYGGQGFAGLITNYPYCVGGILKGNKPGYKEDWQRVVSSAGKVIELNLVSTVKFPADKIKIVKHEIPDLKNPNKYGPAVEMSKSELANLKISFEKEKTGAEINNANPIKPQLTPTGLSYAFHESSVSISKDLTPEVLAAEGLDFLAKADFNYNLEIQVYEAKGEEGDFVGGYKSQWNVPWNQLKNAKSITFHIFSKKGASDDEKIELMFDLGNYSLYLPKPEIK